MKEPAAVTSRLTLRGLCVRAVNVPMTRSLATEGGRISTVPLVLIDLFIDRGRRHGTRLRVLLFCYTPEALQPAACLVSNLELLLKGDEAASIVIERKFQGRFRLLGFQGLAGMAMA